MATASKHPMIYWAQRKATLMLTIAVEDLKIEQLEFKDNTFSFKGSGGSNQVYEANLTLYEKVDPATMHKIDTTRQLELVIGKAESNWWPRLLKESTKVPWIKVDFNKWVDEEDEEEADDDFNFGGELPSDFDPASFDYGEEEPPELADIDTPTTSATPDEPESTKTEA